MFFIYYKKFDRVFIENENLNFQQIAKHIEPRIDTSNLTSIEDDLNAGEIIFGSDEVFYKKMVETKTLDAITIDGRSMVPLLIPNDVIKIEPVMTELAIGDVVVYYSEGILVVHRVIKKSGNIIVTMGDNCHNEDEPTFSDRIIGMVRKRKTSISQRIKWGIYYMKKKKWNKGFGVLVSCVKKIK